MHRSNRSNRKFNRSQRCRFQYNDDDVVNIDWSKPLNRIVIEILEPIVHKDSLPKNQLLAYLNCFTKYCLKRSLQQQSSLNSHHQTNHDNGIELDTLSDNEILSCIRLCLFHDAAEVRAASLRAIRYYVQNKQSLNCLLKLNLQHLIARSLDIVLENRIERVQALRLTRHLLSIDPSTFPLALGRCLCAIAGDNSLEKDMLLRACWATIAELTIVNAVISARAGCVDVIAKCCMNSAIGIANNSSGVGEHLGRETIRDRTQIGNISLNSISNVPGGMLTNLTLPYSNVVISEAMLSSFLHLYNWPDTRRLLKPKGLDLFYFISPFTDTYSFLHASNAARNQNQFYANNYGNQTEDEHLYPQAQNPFVEMKGRQFNIMGNNRQVAKQQQQQQQAQQQQQQQYANYENRTFRYLACKNAILSILRSWPGMFFMCQFKENTENRVPSFQTEDLDENLWEDYSEIYQDSNNHNIHFFLDSLKFFGIPVKSRSNKATQLASGIDRALSTNNWERSSYFTTASYGKHNPLESLIAIFHLPYPEVHRHLIELIYELFGLKTPDWLENFEDSLRCVFFTLPNRKSRTHRQNVDTGSSHQHTKSYFPEEWQLYDGFVAKEAEYILPSRSKNRLNFVSNYCGLMLQVMVEFGILEALVSVILDSNDKAAINLSTILLGELLHLSGKYLPASIYAHRCQSLPTLVAASICNCKTRRNRALTAINHLNQIHELMKNGPKPASLFLEQQIYFCQPNSRIMNQTRTRTSSKNSDDNMVSLIKNSLVLKRSNFKDWNWDMIVNILKHPGEWMRKLDDKDVIHFVRRLLDFFRPSRRQFSSISKNSYHGSLYELSSSSTPSSAHMNSNSRSDPIYVENPRLLCIAATSFIDFLLEADEHRASEFIEMFILDLDLSLKNVATKSPSSDETLIPSRLLSTLSNHYFLLIGRFTHSPVGHRWLDKTQIFQYLVDLISLSTSDVFMKLIVSSLDYHVSFSRTLLSKVLTATPESSRLYATQYMRVLLRAFAPNFSHWPIEYLVGQLYDPCPAVASTALDILDEACSDDDANLEKVISLRPALLHLGDVAIVFISRFVSHPCGLSYLRESNMLSNELTRWKGNFSIRYVRLIEDCLNECFSCHQRSDYGTYGRRSDRRQFPHAKHTSITTYVLPHLYGQLVQTEDGLQILIEQLIVDSLLKSIKEHVDEMAVYYEKDHTLKPSSSEVNCEANVLRMKAALWSIGHIATHERGLMHILEYEEPILFWITTLVKCSPILSMRATCFYVLCLFASTHKGSQLLSEYGWSSIQHSHDEMFPIDEQEYENFYMSNGRLRFISNENHSSGDMMSNPFFSVGEYGSAINVPISRHYSQSSSSSSSYLSMPHTEKSRLDSTNDIESDERKPSFTISSSTSSIYSNTSSVGCLASSNAVPTNTFNRQRSSSDCLQKVIANTEKNFVLNGKVIDGKNQTKLDYQDSGIADSNQSAVEQMAKTNLGKGDVTITRSRKISAPCFAVSTEINRENRSDSNDSSRTGNTAPYSSRSTSFAEYSSSSSGSNILDHVKLDRNVNLFSNSVAINNNNSTIAPGATYKSLPIGSPNQLAEYTMGNHDPLKIQRQMSLVIQSQDDPYPSSVDAHGYAQLRAIQKCRVQSLSGNMFFTGMGNTNPMAVDHGVHSIDPEKSSTKLSNRSHLNSLRSDETTPEILVTDINSNGNTNRQRQVSRTSLQATSPETGDFKRLRIPSVNVITTDVASSITGPLKTIQRSLSRVSKGSCLSTESLSTFVLDDVPNEGNVSAVEQIDKPQFMCLCLPDSLALMFHLEESNQTSKSKRVQFSTKSHRNTKTSQDKKLSCDSAVLSRACLSLLSNVYIRRDSFEDGLEIHCDSKCMACCIKINRPVRSTELTDNSNSPIITASTSKSLVSNEEHGTNKLYTSDTLTDMANFGKSTDYHSSSPLRTTTLTPNNINVLQRKEVLRLVSNLSAAMYAKQSEQGLLSFKQRFPHVFEDFCLYSEVCLQMESFNFRATARRFLHELFLEVNLDQLYNDAESIFKNRNNNEKANTKVNSEAM